MQKPLPKLAFKHVDFSYAEKQPLIRNAMTDLQQKRTSFVVAHRLSTIRNADKIIVLNHGHIIETGNHQSLMAKKGFYADLYNSQFESAS